MEGSSQQPNRTQEDANIEKGMSAQAVAPERTAAFQTPCNKPNTGPLCSQYDQYDCKACDRIELSGVWETTRFTEGTTVASQEEHVTWC
ncbi:hypothetical protein PpBr36_02500 [Pyricularia pennisetigena]|uniref:hypothetical protein n=1 Tax=Pyricularia pennisetigena TaxID=1578925 RepID=UPI001154CFB9|nr:hypothetical protein PpBr36_02500 [Pyricularia pennisetigena]TLS30636.1 hypothetical protein PpBr36_02500 [Pyricularia pennisetigena]